MGNSGARILDVWIRGSPRRTVGLNGGTDFFASFVDEEVDVNLTGRAVGETDHILEA